MTRGRPVRFMCFNIFVDRNFSLLSFNHYLQYPFHTAPSSTPLSLVSFITHTTTTVYYLQLQTLLRLSKHHSIKSTNVYNSSIRYHVLRARYNKRKPLEKNHREIKFLHECPFHFLMASGYPFKNCNIGLQWNYQS